VILDYRQPTFYSQTAKGADGNARTSLAETILPVVKFIFAKLVDYNCASALYIRLCYPSAVSRT
jgi:hypothetical protein